MWNLLAILALAAATTGDATATRLDGAVVSGQLQSWQDERLTLASPTGPVEIAEADLLSLELAPGAAAASGQPVLELVDGSTLPIDDFSFAGKNAKATLARSTTTTVQEIDIPLRQVRAVRMQPLDESLVAQWREIHDLKSPSDVLVVLKREGKSLDYLEGVVEEVTPTEVAFNIDGETVRVARGKVAGVIYYRAETDETADGKSSPCVLLGSEGLRAVAKSVRVDGANVHVVSAAGVEFAWPLVDIFAADFSTGKIVYLSDLKPVTQTWQPLVALPPGAKYAARFGQPRIDRSAAGGPLSLAFPNADQPDGAGKLETFAKGLALRSRSEFVVRLPSGYRRFLAVAGIEPTTQASGNVMLTIFGDDRVLMESPVVGNSAPLAIELDVANVKRLRIVVDYGQNLDTGDWLNLCNARLVK